MPNGLFLYDEHAEILHPWPEYALEEIPEIRKRKSYTLRDSWNRVASRGSDQRS